MPQLWAAGLFGGEGEGVGRWVQALPPGFLGIRLSPEPALTPGGEEDTGGKRVL